MPTVPQESSNQESSNQESSDQGSLSRDAPVSEADLVHRAIDHAIVLRESVSRIADPFLGTVTDLVLFELGCHLARLESR